MFWSQEAQHIENAYLLLSRNQSWDHCCSHNSVTNAVLRMEQWAVTISHTTGQSTTKYR